MDSLQFMKTPLFLILFTKATKDVIVLLLLFDLLIYYCCLGNRMQYYFAGF